MRRILILFVLTLIPLCSSFAQSRSMSFDFTYLVDSQPPVKGSGNALICDDNFHVILDGVDYWCDGQTMWIVDKSSKEIYIQEPEDFSVYLKTAILSYSGDVVKGAEIKLEDGNKAILQISNYSVPDSGKISFRVDVSKFSTDYIVTDLR